MTVKELRKQFLKCNIICNSILEGKLYHCPRSSHGANLGVIPAGKNDYIDLLDEKLTYKELRKELYDFFYKYVPYVNACNYCNNGTKEITNITAGEQIKRNMGNFNG